MLKKHLKELLINQLNYITTYSKFYIEKLKTKRLSFNNFKNIDFTTKEEILEDQKEFPPFGRNLIVHRDKIIRVHKTSGTTNTPVIIALTKNDIKNTVKVGARCFESSGVLSSDLIVHCLNYNMWTGGYTDHQSLEAAGAAVIPFGVGNSENLVEMILLLRPTAIHCTPSYLSKLENITKIKFNLSPKDLKLRLGLFGGESGLQNKSFRDYIETTWGFKAMNANYGMSEVLSMVGAECSYRMGLHFMGEDIIYPELLDLKSGEILLIEEGVIGELVLTNLRKEAQPLLRYRTNDIIKVLGTACKCSNTGFRFEVVGRSDDMLVIKGINVFVNSIERIITKYLDVVTGLYHILLSKVDPIDKIVLKIEVRGNKSQETNNFKERIIKDFKNSLGIKPDVEFISEGSLERTEDKSKIIYRNL